MKYILMTIVVLLVYGVCEARILTDTKEVCVNGYVYVTTTIHNTTNGNVSTSIVQSYERGISDTFPSQPRTCK